MRLLLSAFGVILIATMSARVDAQGLSPIYREFVESPAQSVFVTVVAEGTILVLSSDTFDVLLNLSTHDEQDFMSADWNPDGTRLAVGNRAGEVSIFCVDLQDNDTCNSGDEIVRWQANINNIQSISWHPDGNSILTASAGGDAFTIWDASNYSIVQVYGPTFAVLTDAEWSPDGELLAFTDLNGGVGLMNETLSFADVTETIDYPDAGGYAVSWSPDGNLLALSTGVTNQTEIPNVVSIWHRVEGEMVAVLQEHDDVVMAMAWSPEGDYLATTGLDNKLIIWNTATWEIHTEQSRGFGPLTLAWLKSSNVIVSGSRVTTPLVTCTAITLCDKNPM